MGIRIHSPDYYRTSGHFYRYLPYKRTNQIEFSQSVISADQWQSRLLLLTDTVVAGSLREKVRVVDPLGSREDLLPPHKHVVRVGVLNK